ncbi:golgin subfamily B member 1 isoform X2 [Ixodes scapularis]|uniref:golgin subfamily B member 1 isoform X2 n=1 Tax=Ixodes scapularis TaxID=6945 RepID=UPI001A9EE8BA|nr:golgin subfamily B member 1 isoform X2 [Ixodes scapularis]
MDRRAMDESFITDTSSSVGDPEVSVGAPLMAAQARRMMPLQTKSLRDYEEHLIKLERENLHLRLRHFYMQQQKDPEASAGTAEFEAFKSEMLGDVDRLTKEIGERNALLQKTWLTVEQQHDAIEQLKQEKADLEKELHKFQSKTSFAEAVHDDNVKMANNVSQVQRQNKHLESEVKALKIRLQELENVEAPSMRHQLDKKILALKNLSTVVTRQEDVIEALRSQQALLSSVEPMTEAFLQRIEDALASKDIQGALLAKDKFRRDLGNVVSKHHTSQQDISAEFSHSESSLKKQVWHLEAELEAKETTIEGLRGEMLLLSSNLESCQERCRDLESEIERSSQMHMRICTEKDKLLESVQFRVQELENSAQEALTLKSHLTALERECTSLQAAVQAKSNFIQELLSERNAAALETERSFQDLLRSLKQKDDLVDQLQTKLTCVTEKAAVQVSERIGTHEASGSNLIDLSLQGTAGAGENATQETTAEKFLSPLKSPTNAEDGLSDNLATELDELCSIIRDLGRQAGLFLELSTVNGEQSGIAKALKDALKDARDRGLRVALLPTRHEVNDKENGTPADCEPSSKTQSEPRDMLVLSTLGEKLKQVCNLFAIEKTLPESGRDWSAKDVMDHVELILEKAKQWTADSGNASFDLRKSHEVSLQESMEKLRGVVRWLQDESSRNHSDIASFQEAVLSDLNPALECIAVLRDEVDTLCASWRAQDGSGKRCSSVDELVYAVNLSGRLVPVESSLETTRHGEKSSKDVSQQTSDADVDIETLKSDLSKSRAQVKFLQKALKDSFSVKITESPTSPGGHPLIEIDQNRPLPNSPLCLSPRKSGSSANRHWRKQLTNQKMSEFGLSENVFELQEEIFFLVLRIEDLEKQLKERPEVVGSNQEPTQDGSLGPEQLGDKRHVALEAQLRDMQEMSAVLLCRLEELAAFLEQLLTYDGSGPLGSVTLSADVVAKMRQLIADSKDFSLSVSQSILGSDTGSVLSEHHTRSSLQRGMHSVLSSGDSKGPKGEKDGSSSSGSRKLDPKTIPPCPEDIAFMEDEVNMLREQVQLQQREISALTHRLEERQSREGPATPVATVTTGRSKRPAPSARTESHKLEKLLRRVHHCNGKLEDSLVLHRELCHKMLAGPTGEKESPDQPQPSAELLDTHIQTMRKLQFKLEEMVINNELLLEILTEHLASGSMITTDSKMSAPSSGNTQASAAERLEQYKKELECKERRQEILKRAILREQNSKLQLEKELSECQKELQSLHEAHTSLKEDYKEVLRKTSDTGQREARQRNLRPQKDAKTSRAGKLEALGSSFEKSDNSEFVSGSRKPDGGRHSQGVARLSQELASLREEVANLQEEKAVLTQKLETTQKEHEILLESSSNKISELVTKLGPLSTQNKIQQEEIRSARELNDNLAEENGKLQCDLDAAFSKLDALDRELESLQRENRDLRECVLTSRSQENMLKEKLEKIGEEFQALKKTSEERARKGDVLEREKDELATELSKLTAHLESYESEKQLLYEEKQRLILEVSAEKDQVERISNELQRCEQERDTLRTHGSELEEQLHASTEKLQEAEQMASELKEELGATKGKLESMDVRCGQLEEELSSSKEAQRQLLWKSDELQRALDAVGREVQQNKSFARASLDRKHVMAFRELEDQNRSLQGAVMELKSKLDKAFHDNKCLRLELRVNEQFQPRSSPGTPSDHRCGASRSVENHGQAGLGSSSCGASPPRLSPRQPSLDCGRQLQAGLYHARSHHTSPDLGIDSDPTPEHDVAANDSAGALAEHWQHRMGPSWTLSSVNSAPDAMGGSCQLCQQGKDSAASWKQKASATYAGEQLEQTSFGASKNVFPGPQSSRSSPSMPLCAIVQLVDHELLKKRVDESICLIRRVEVIIHQALDALADFASDCTEPPECKGLLQDADRGCHSIKVCLVDSFKLICSFTISHVPDCREDHCSHEKQLKLELNKLQEKHSQQSIELQNALEQISSFKEKREGMERAISRQLSKTKMVLKQTKGNLNVLRTRDTKHEKK